MSDIELFSMPLCPFAHRVRLVLAEKAIAYRLTEIDLGNKPQAFPKVSPYGKVPALRHGDTHICESAIINEYLDETFPEPPLLPREPARRAQARFWIEFANSRLFAVTHVSFGVREPKRVAQVLAELTQAAVVRAPTPPFPCGAWLVVAGDEQDSFLEALPATSVFDAAAPLGIRQQPATFEPVSAHVLIRPR